MRIHRTTLASCLLVVFLGALTTDVAACDDLDATVTLQSLLDGGSLRACDLVFDSFEYSIDRDHYEQWPSEVDILASPVFDDANSAAGLRFQIPFSLTDLPAGGAALHSVQLNYIVNVDAGSSLTSALLDSDITTDNFFSLRQSFSNGGPELSLTWRSTTFGARSSREFDQPPATLDVSTRFRLGNVGDEGAFSLSYIEQTFATVPEPVAVAPMFAAVVAALTSWRRRKASAALIR